MREPNTSMMPIGKPRLIKNALQVGQDPDEFGATPRRIRELAIVHSGLRVSRAGEFRRLSLRRDKADRQRECDSQCVQRGLHDFIPFSDIAGLRSRRRHKTTDFATLRVKQFTGMPILN